MFYRVGGHFDTSCPFLLGPFVFGWSKEESDMAELIQKRSVLYWIEFSA